MKSLNLPSNLDNILIIKGNNSINLTRDGVFLSDNIIKFKKKWNLTCIEPGVINEIKLIHIIHSCSVFVVSWGTSFMKNFVYISNKCRKIIVLIMKGSNFQKQYDNLSHSLMKKFKKAKIIYKIIDSDLNDNLY